MDAGLIWDTIILNPMINILVVLTKYLFSNLGLSIILLTIVIRGVMYPMTRKQLLSSKKMQDLQPKVADLQKKFGKDRQRLAKEQMALYKEAGVNPVGCLLQNFIQMPVWLALYQSITRVLATGPEELLNLSRHLYPSWSFVFEQVPLNSRFLWMDLGVADKIYLLPVLVGATMWVQQKMVTPQHTDPQQQANAQMMLWVMPLMFTFFSFSFPSGLALYWLTSNLISVIMQYFVSGWGGLATVFKKQPPPKPPAKPTSASPQRKQIDTPSLPLQPPTSEKGKQPWMFWK